MAARTANRASVPPARLRHQPGRALSSTAPTVRVGPASGPCPAEIRRARSGSSVAFPPHARRCPLRARIARDVAHRRDGVRHLRLAGSRTSVHRLRRTVRSGSPSCASRRRDRTPAVPVLCGLSTSGRARVLPRRDAAATANLWDVWLLNPSPDETALGAVAPRVRAAGGRRAGCVFCHEAAGSSGLEPRRAPRRAGVRAPEQFPYSSGHLMVAPVRHVPGLGDLDPDEAAEIHALTVQAIAALTARATRPTASTSAGTSAQSPATSIARTAPHVVPRWAGDTNFMPVLADVKVLPEHLESTRRPDARPGSDPRARREPERPPAGSRPGASSSPTRRDGSRSTSAPGTGPHSATVQRVRLEPTEVVPAVEEIRAILRARGRSGAEWELGESCTPPDLVERLAALGIVPDEDEPVAIGMVLTAAARCEAAGDLRPPRSVGRRARRRAPHPARGVRRHGRGGRVRAGGGRLRDRGPRRLDVPRVRRRRAGRGRLRLVHAARPPALRRRHAPLGAWPWRLPGARRRPCARGGGARPAGPS